MRRKQKKSTPIVFICSLIAGIFILTGCYLKQKPTGQFTAGYDDIGPKKILQNDWDKFFSDVKKVDGRAKAHYDMAVYFQKRNKHNLALQDFQKAIQSDPTDAKTYNAMGISYDKTGDQVQAIQCYEMAVKLDPEMASAHNNLGYSKMLKGDAEGAIDAYRQAIKLDDKNPRYRNNLAMLYAKSGKIEQARKQLEVQDDQLAADQKLDKLLGKSVNIETRQKPAVILDILNKETTHPIKNEEINLTAEDEETEDPQPEPEETKVVEIIYNNELQPSKQSNNNGDVYTAVVAKEIEHPQQDLNEPKAVEIIYEKDAQNSRPDSRDDLEVQSLVTTKINTSDPLKIAKPPTNGSTESPFALCSVSFITETNNIADVLQEIDTIDYPSSTHVEKDKVSIIENKASAGKPKLVEVIFREQTERSKQQITSAKLNAKYDSHKSPKMNQISYESIKIVKVKSSNPNNNLSWLSENIKSEKQNANIKNEVEVANGNGIRGEARRFATYLKSKGFKISKITNARSFDHSTTKVLFSGENFDIVYQLFSDLSYEIDDADIIELKRMGDRMRIIIGKDMALVDTRNDIQKKARTLAKK
jgi:tetratricopeptide (TPR) repeat protein